jgi:hypothetical protein
MSGGPHSQRAVLAGNREIVHHEAAVHQCESRGRDNNFIPPELRELS